MARSEANGSIIAPTDNESNTFTPSMVSETIVKEGAVKSHSCVEDNRDPGMLLFDVNVLVVANLCTPCIVLTIWTTYRAFSVRIISNGKFRANTILASFPCLTLSLRHKKTRQRNILHVLSSCMKQ